MASFTIDMATGDLDPPGPGDVIYGPRVHYRVTGCRPVESRIWPWRYRLDVARLGPWTTRPPDAITSQPYRRGEGPRDCFGDPPPNELDR